MRVQKACDYVFRVAENFFLNIMRLSTRFMHAKHIAFVLSIENLNARMDI